VVPDYIDVSYEVVIWTDYIEQMNSLVESLIYTEGAYWGDTESFKFRTKIDNWTNTTDLLQDADRIVRTNFELTIFGHIVPDVLVKQLSKKQSNKTFDTRQVVFEITPDADPSVFQQTEQAVVGGAVFTTPTVSTSINPLSLVNASTVAYLNTNKAIQATTVTVPNTAYFNGSFLPAPSGLPTTSITSFSFFVNGQYIEPSALVSFTESAGVCTLIIDPAQLGFTLALTDEIVAIGKFA
jgi:hypothetical protein